MIEYKNAIINYLNIKYNEQRKELIEKKKEIRNVTRIIKKWKKYNKKKTKNLEKSKRINAKTDKNIPTM